MALPTKVPGILANVECHNKAFPRVLAIYLFIFCNSEWQNEFNLNVSFLDLNCWPRFKDIYRLPACTNYCVHIVNENMSE